MDAEIIIVHKVNTNDNLSVLLTKSISAWKRVQLRSCIMYSENPNISFKAS